MGEKGEARIYLILQFQKLIGGEYSATTTAVAATSSDQAEAIFLRAIEPSPERQRDTFVMTDAAVRDAANHGGEARMWTAGGRNPDLSKASYLRWQDVMLSEHWSDGVRLPAVYRRFGVLHAALAIKAAPSAGRFSAFSDTELAVIRDAFSVYAPKTIGRDRSIAETLIVELPPADALAAWGPSMNDSEIDVTGVDLVALVKAVYDESSSQGLGFLHFTPAPLTDDEAKALIRKDDRFGPINLDYVKGRAVKFAVMRRGDRLFVRSQWFDHSPSQLQRVLAKVGITTEPTAA